MDMLPTEPSGLCSFLNPGKLTDYEGASNEKFVLTDECGDNLWNEVLAQENDRLNSQGNCQNQGLPNNDAQQSGACKSE